MEKHLIQVEKCYGHRILYDPVLFEQYLVLWPKWNGKSELHRFDTLEEARGFISDQVPESWFEKHLA